MRTRIPVDVLSVEVVQDAWNSDGRTMCELWERRVKALLRRPTPVGTLKELIAFVEKAAKLLDQSGTTSHRWSLRLACKRLKDCFRLRAVIPSVYTRRSGYFVNRTDAQMDKAVHTFLQKVCYRKPKKSKRA